MVVAKIDWQAVAAVIGGIGLIVSLVVAFIALGTANAAKTQAKAAEDQARAAATQAEIAEREHARATEPRLRLARYPDGSPKIDDAMPFVWIGDGPPREIEWFKIEVENLRDAAADIQKVRVNGQPADVRETSCEKDGPGWAHISAGHMAAEQSPYEIVVVYRARDSGRGGELRATVELRDGNYVVTGEESAPLP